MLWLAVTTVLVCVWLFREKLPYMKLSMVVGLALCAVFFWADVDARVAQYNVRAYQQGRLETVDVLYLSTLSSGAVPYLQELTEDADAHIAQQADDALTDYYLVQADDLRGWNWTAWRAAQILEDYKKEKRQ